MEILNMPSGPLMVNTYLVIDEKNKEGFIVDPGGYDTGLIGEIRKKQTDIKYIILTHGHGDHIGGVKGYRKYMPGAKVVASAAEKELLADASMNMSMMTQNEAIEVHPDMLVDEGDELFVGDMKLRFIMTPGHSPGGMCIHTENALFSGDTLFIHLWAERIFRGHHLKNFQKLYTKNCSSFRRKPWYIRDIWAQQVLGLKKRTILSYREN